MAPKVTNNSNTSNNNTTQIVMVTRKSRILLNNIGSLRVKCGYPNNGRMALYNSLNFRTR